MKVQFSKDFAKSMARLSGKMLESVKNAINEVIDAESLNDITDCLKIVGLEKTYRIRIGDKRAFFILEIDLSERIANFQYLVNRGEAYSKEMKKKLKSRES